jgi:hypothetical protein
VRPRVYVQIRDESQRPEANRLAAALRDKDKGGFLVPDFQVVAIGPLRNELRYLDPGEREEAERAAAVLEGLGFPVSPHRPAENEGAGEAAALRTVFAPARPVRSGRTVRPPSGACQLAT